MGIELPIVSILCAVLLLCLIPAYLIAGNVAATSLVGWLLLCNLIQAVDSTVWENNTSIRTPAWCDIATKLLLGARIALPAACLGISRHLRRRTSTFDFGSRRSIPWADYALCFVLPIMYMILHIIVQDHRFDLLQNYGCTASVYSSLPALILVWLPPSLLSIAALVGSSITLYHPTRRQAIFAGAAPSFSPKSNNFAFFRRPSRPAPPLDLGPQPAPEEDAHYNRPNSPPPRPSSILSEPWPRPPSAIPISPVVPVTIHPPSPRPGHAPSRPPSRASFSTSLASSTVTMSAYASDVERALRDSPTLPQFAPFADAGMPTGESHARGLSLAVPKRTRKMRSKDVMVTRNLSLSLRTRERAREEEGTGPGIYMTVVKETV
ncbi:hypothetical fungal pheromone GPCR [Postia placenta Mad-698-R]|nr:hypothetical fungal pheromone GPCR [Postia placenta Mad-698-R]